MIIEMARYQWNIDIACLTNRLAIVQRFQHSQQARMLLNMPSNRVKIASAQVSWRLAPAFKGLSCRRYSLLYILAIPRSNLGEFFSGRGIDAIEILAA